ncbi:MAG: hypothetical protein H6920_10275 [Sphingomonadaceae bacterium]|nr:hypothetical protein [Sphingomonadaceae bacterium]MCP5383803.1 hypothetical protein [Altererythrobacter sp.]MCP5391990.1 hypothetical protein [Sphingomonadaceae bacterium]MCP5394310.1 hypothetical protein [Sphingomonadaceae bacterium]
MDWRPDLPPFPLADQELAKIGWIAICEARSRAMLLECWKAANGAPLADMRKLERKPLEVLADMIDADKLPKPCLLPLEKVREIVRDASDTRHRLIHGIWGENPDVGVVVFDRKTRKAFDAEELENGLRLMYALAERCHGLTVSIALAIERGEVVPHSFEDGCARMKTYEGSIHF